MNYPEKSIIREFDVKKALSYFFLLLCVPYSLQAACVEGDCRNGSGKLEGEDGRIYVGEFKNRYLWGEGILTHPDGTVYSGQFQRGKYHGTGSLGTPDGKKYEGTQALTTLARAVSCEI